MPAAPARPALLPLLPLLTERFSDVPLALSLGQEGHLQLAVLAAAAVRQGIPASAPTVPAGGGHPARRMLRLDLEARVAWCHGGRIVTGPAGAEPAACRPLNGDAARITAHKPTLNRLLATQGFSTPAGQEFAATDRDAALRWAQDLGGPVCVKPPSGSLGWGVTPGLREGAALTAAFDTVAGRCGSVLLEQHVTGAAPLPADATVRIMWVTPDHVTLRMDRPAHLTGDGQRPVSALLSDRNARRAARTGQPPILPDAALLALLAEQHLTPAAVPAAGQLVALRRVSNASQGGDSHTDLPDIHPSYAAEVIRLFRSLPGARAGAADLILAEPTAPCRPGNHWILDVNLSPGIVQYHFPWGGPPRDIAAALIEKLRLEK